MPADMHPADIKAEIHKRGISMTELAEDNGLSKQTLIAAIGARVSGRAEKIIADFIERKPAEIWPSRYHRNGRRIMLRRTAKRAEVA
ncbi:helix-turn-helix domain-containing protein [Erythrobacter sp. LQ02-29]|uniref:helix-turn-helix domain-containing protein n=1 Tax=Erythrobacter sp. LQ02-29 TaxID=2920384 RepID=UPI001F4E52A2|nr:helix-turn-helix domain-containing protein [Erythrobacter sp. LQ02-29]